MNERWWIGALMLPLIVGCGVANTGTVSGKVTYAGKPLSTGTVIIYPEQGGGLMANVGADGSYEAVGVPTGNARIAVQLPVTRTLPKRSEKSGVQLAGWEKEVKEIQDQSSTHIPLEYMDPGKSGLSLMVERGRQTHDIVLTKK